MSHSRKVHPSFLLLMGATLCACQLLTGAGVSQPTPAPTAQALPSATQPAPLPTPAEPPATAKPAVTRTAAPRPKPIASPTRVPQAVTALQVVVRAPDNSVKILDAGVVLDPAAPPALNGLLPQGGVAGAEAYVLNFTDQSKAEAVSADGSQALDFVQGPDYGLAVWPGGNGAAARLAWGTSPSDDGHTSLVVADVDGAHLTKLLTEDGNQPGPHQLVAQRWSADGQALYFSREPVGIGGYILFSGASSLYRMDVASRKVTELIPFKMGSGGRMICLDALSADEHREADHCTANVITVRDLTTGQATTVKPPAGVKEVGALGSARFSPDGKRLAYALAKNDMTAEQGWLAVSDGLSGASRLVYTGQPGETFNVDGWLDSQTLLVESNGLACTTTCNTQLLAVPADGSSQPVKLGEGTFLSLAGE